MSIRDQNKKEKRKWRSRIEISDQNKTKKEKSDEWHRFCRNGYFSHRGHREPIAAYGRNQICSHEGIYNAVKSTKGTKKKKVLVPFIICGFPHPGKKFVIIRGIRGLPHMRLIGDHITGRQLLKLFLETLDKIRSTGKSHFESHIPYIAITSLQQLGPPLETVRTYKITGGLTG
jgi:hypothetical protein